MKVFVVLTGLVAHAEGTGNAEVLGVFTEYRDAKTASDKHYGVDSSWSRADHLWLMDDCNIVRRQIDN